MEVPKVHLSFAEKELMMDAGIILTKNSVLEKVGRQLEGVAGKQQAYVQDNACSDKIFHTPPKVSRGERYEGLPWLILDYPRYAAGSNIFFIRSMFWWGNFFSSTLHLAGSMVQQYGDDVAASYPLLTDHAIGIHPDPWRHHFEKDNYRTIGTMTENKFSMHCKNNSHLKIARRWKLDDWEEIPAYLLENWKLYGEICGQLPRR